MGWMLGLGQGDSRHQVLLTHDTQDPKSRCLQGFMEDGHGPQLTLQRCGASPPSVLGACKGGADATLLQRGPQPRPPAQACGGWH